MILNDLRFRRLLSFVLALLFCFTLFADPLAVRGHAVAVVDDLAVVGVIAALGAFGLSITSIGNNGSGISSTVRGWIDSSGADATGSSASVVGGGVLQVNSIAMRTAKAIYDWITGLFAEDEQFDGSFAGSFTGVIPSNGTYSLETSDVVPVASFLASFPFGGEVISYINSHYDFFHYSVNDLGFAIIYGADSTSLNIILTISDSPIETVEVYASKLYVDNPNRTAKGVSVHNNGRPVSGWSVGSFGSSGSGISLSTTVPAYGSKRCLVNLGSATVATSVSVDSDVDASAIPLNDGYIVTPFTFADDAQAIADFNDAISLGESYTGEYTDVYDPAEPIPDYTDSLNDLKTGVGAAVDALEGLQTSVDDLNDRVAAQDIPIEEVQSGGRAGLSTIFPFCIPFDLVDFLRTMNAARAAPHFDIPLDFGDLGSFTMEIDLSDWDPVAQILRTMELLLFCVGLVLLTRNIIRG